MNELFEKNQIIKIIPQDVNHACSAIILNCENNKITAKPNKNINALTGECECFSVTKAGIVYFKSTINTENDVYIISDLKDYTIMQRREYTRIKFNQTTELELENQKYPVTVTDLSAGGMKILSSNELKMSGEYKGTLNLGRSEINITYTPIRQEKNDDGSFLISGKFQNISHKDRIAVIQYSFSRKMESTNK